MSEQETPQAIHDAAAGWVARIDRVGDDPAAQAELETWLAGDERRRGAYYRAQVAWAMLDRASALRTGRHDEEPEQQEIERRGWLSRRRLLVSGGAAAASVAAAAIGIGLWPRSAGPVAADRRIETAVGEIRRVPLADGSLAAVNTQTRLDVRLAPDIRRVALDQGEAWFEVAHDRTRPFVVEVGDVRVRAVGTAFSVRRTARGAEVRVTEGVVEVWRVSDENTTWRLAAGAQSFVSYEAGPQPAAEPLGDVDRTLAWRNGQLIFDGDTLGEAVAEFNRYNTTQVRIADPALAGERFVGRFRTNEPDAFARAAANILDARVRFHDNEIVLSRD
jgi:transmembrane sensor